MQNPSDRRLGPVLQTTINPLRLGIAVITYNRLKSLSRTIDKIRTYTRAPYSLIVADDGSTDNSAEVMRQNGTAVVTGMNMGVCWNKNRALFWLFNMAGCDVVILLEDDAFPVEEGWETQWATAAARYGHVNYAGSWFSKIFTGGTGTIEDPFRSPQTSGQCTAFSRSAISYVGYLDTRFRGYGYGHGEHTIRFARAGFGAEMSNNIPSFFLISGGVDVIDENSHRNVEQLAKNAAILKETKLEPVYRWPWRDEDEMVQLKSEMNSVQLV